MRRIGLSAALGMAMVLAAGSAGAEPTAKQRELAHRYIAAIHMDRTIDQTLNAIMPAMLASAPKNDKLTDKDRQMLLEVTAEVTRDMMTKMIARMEPLIADTFSEEELQGLVSFYESPTGQSFVSKSPQLAAKMAPMMKELIPETQAEMVQKICARMDCTAAQKAAGAKPS